LAAMLITSTVEICIQQLCQVEEVVFVARRMCASAVLGAVILSFHPSVRLSHMCFVTNPKNLPAIFLHHMKGQSFQSNVIFRTVVQQLTTFQLT